MYNNSTLLYRATHASSNTTTAQHIQLAVPRLAVGFIACSRLSDSGKEKKMGDWGGSAPVHFSSRLQFSSFPLSESLEQAIGFKEPNHHHKPPFRPRGSIQRSAFYSGVPTWHLSNSFQIDWLQFLRRFYDQTDVKITEDMEVVVLGLDALRNAVHLIGNTTKRYLSVYICSFNGAVLVQYWYKLKKLT